MALRSIPKEIYLSQTPITEELDCIPLHLAMFLLLPVQCHTFTLLSANLVPSFVSGPGTHLKRPSRISIDANDKLYVTDSLTGNLIMIDSASGNETVVSSGTLSSPTGLAIKSDGSIVVISSGDNAVVLMESNSPTNLTVLPVPVANTSIALQQLVFTAQTVIST